MSMQDLTQTPASSEPLEHSETLFQDLDQAFQTLWQTEISQYRQTIQPAVVSPPRSRAGRSRKARTPSKASPIRPKQPSSTLTAPSPRQRMPRTKARPAAGWIKAAGVAAGVVGLSMGSYQWVQAFQQSRELPPLRQVMYQNAQSKVAAFRKEIMDGEYYLADTDHPVEYIAEAGDTVEKISNKFHVTPNTIIKNNVRSKINDVIEPGTKLYILPHDGIVHPVEKHETLAELSKRYRVGIQDILDANQLDNPHMITENQKIIIPNATELKRRPKPVPVKNVLQTIREASTGQATPVLKTRTGRRLSWPTAGIVTSGFGWRWFRMHTGMDIAGPIGTPVKAAKEGRVVFSGWMGGYGYCIDIDHGNGITTRYGHNSSLHVQTGAYVYRGQTISAMGSTGHSTGPHLHFEVRINGEPVDPRGYF